MVSKHHKGSEYEEQSKLVEYLYLLENQKKIVYFFAIQNENPMSYGDDRRRAINIANKQKKLGKRRGIADVCIMLVEKTIYIEMKWGKGIASKEQNDFKEILSGTKHNTYHVCRGFDEAKELVDNEIRGKQ